jgi:hypothetical protein
MKWVVIALLFVAMPAYAEESPLAPWLGTWKGSVKSKGCVDAARKVAIEVAQTPEGALRSNGDLFVEGLGDLDWMLDGKKLATAREGLKGSFTRGKKTATLKLRTDGGCTITATLKRTKKVVPVATASITGLPNCDVYIRSMESYMRCDKVPQSARDAAKAGLDAMNAGWRDMGDMPEDARKAANDACGQAVDALRQGAQAMGCTL